MTRERNSKFSQHHAFTRVLSLLLLGFIVYGTTVEAAHNHGNPAAANSVVGAANLSDPATGTKTTTKLPGCGDCLICQLHQSFSTALITFRLMAPPPRQRVTVPTRAAKSVRSQTNTPTSDRGPPSIS